MAKLSAVDEMGSAVIRYHEALRAATYAALTLRRKGIVPPSVSVHLYRYPHPTLPDVWLYVGQGPNRDQKHRSGMSSFGRRFKKRFPNVELPQPVRWEMEVSNALEKNEEETIAMFQYHTWWGYEGGMNLTLPGSADYKNMGTIGGPIGGPIGSREAKAKGSRNQPREAKVKGSRNQPREAKAKGGHTQGCKNVESGHLARIRTPESSAKGGPIGRHTRWHVKRGIVNPACSLCVSKEKRTVTEEEIKRLTT